MNNMKYLIMGNGYLGSKFHQYFKDSVLSRKRIHSTEDVITEIEAYNPQWVINCAGKTGTPNVDWCEDHKEETLQGNVLLPLWIAKACQNKGIRMLHLGSGCVYEGDNNGKGFSEDDLPNFTGSFYSQTKALSESLLKSFNILQLRLRMPVDDNLTNPRNFITKIITYKQIINVRNSVTMVSDLLRAAQVLMEKNAEGVYNITNPGPISHAEILELYKLIVDPAFRYTIISMDELGRMTKAGRSNCVLNTQKIEKELQLPTAKDAIRLIFEKEAERRNAI